MMTIAMMMTVTTTTARRSATTTPITVLLELLPLVSPVPPLLPSVIASVFVALEHVYKQQTITETIYSITSG